MKIVNGVYKNEIKERKVKLLVFENNLKTMKGIDLTLLKEEEKEELLVEMIRHEKEIRKYVKKAFRCFKTDNFLTGKE
jgi:hypothetical protein